MPDDNTENFYHVKQTVERGYRSTSAAIAKSIASDAMERSNAISPLKDAITFASETQGNRLVRDTTLLIKGCSATVCKNRQCKSGRWLLLIIHQGSFDPWEQ
jgi:hypothetical protein